MSSSLTLQLGKELGWFCWSEAGPEPFLDTTLLAGEVMGLVHGLSSDHHHHLSAVSLRRLKANSKALGLTSVATNRNTLL